jgi:hypothetical protein
MTCKDRQRLAGWCAAVAGEALEERRSELFWRYRSGRLDPAVAAEIERHAASCEDCRNALEAEAMLAVSRAGGKVLFAKCPSSEELLQYLERDPALGPFRRLEIKGHLDRCELCREETSWAAGRVAPPKAAKRRIWTGWKWSWPLPAAAAAVLLVAWIYPSQFGSRRYARYAQVPDVPYEAMIAEFAALHPEEKSRFQTAAQLISLGEYSQGTKLLQDLESRHAGDPTIQFFRGYVALREGRSKEAALLCTKAEKRSLDGFRCWYLANVALLAGDVELAKKEIRHAKAHEPYTDLARRLEQIVD